MHKGWTLGVMVLAGLLWVPVNAEAGLIERLMGVQGFEKISVHQFFAINNERIAGKQTRQNVIDALGLTAADLTDYDALAAQAPGGSTALAEAQKSLFLNTIHSVLILAEMGTAGYNTPALVRARLGL